MSAPVSFFINFASSFCAFFIISSNLLFIRISISISIFGSLVISSLYFSRKFSSVQFLIFIKSIELWSDCVICDAWCDAWCDACCDAFGVLVIK